MSVVLCPDGQSPELSTPCPTDPVLHINYPRDLAATGEELVVWVLVALVLILLGVLSLVGRRI